MTSNTQSELAELALRANEAHGKCQAAANAMLQHARECGDYLLAAKQAVRHGEFEGWIAQHCEFSVRMARRYMRIAKGWSQLMALSIRTRASDLELESLSVREALCILAAEKVADGGSLFVDQRCPTCGEPLMVTSKRFVTCGSCWDCRLFPNPGYHGKGLPNGWEACCEVSNWFSRVRSPAMRAEAISLMLDSLGTADLQALAKRLKESESCRDAIRSLVELVHMEGALAAGCDA